MSRAPKVGDIVRRYTNYGRNPYFSTVTRATASTAWFGDSATDKVSARRGNWRSAWDLDFVSAEFVAAWTAYMNAMDAWRKEAPAGCERDRLDLSICVQLKIEAIDERMGELSKHVNAAREWIKRRPEQPREEDYPLPAETAS